MFKSRSGPAESPTPRGMGLVQDRSTDDMEAHMLCAFLAKVPTERTIETKSRKLTAKPV